MNYYAIAINDYPYAQLSNFNADSEEYNLFIQLLYDYPLVFLPKDNSIIFFGMHVKLVKQNYNTLYFLVENSTKEGKNKGINPVDLFKKNGCSPSRIDSEKYGIDPNYTFEKVDGRIRDIKRSIRKSIKNTYDLLNKNTHDEDSEIFKPTNFYCIKQLDTRKIFCNSIEIDTESPYYYAFDFKSCFNLLIYNLGKGINKKYTTKFVFKNELNQKSALDKYKKYSYTKLEQTKIETYKTEVTKFEN